ncbi:hypothetical protein CCB80_10265 [Armatimonadetes bacterium Uphvl-Ar1]|nr:hypothetical protein CCB80_10265 [Armatimonadetes bacterium Uphvl-Ar1]
MVYDAAGRMTGEVYQNGNLNTFTYDVVGRMTSVQDRIGQTTNTYDANGRLTKQQLPGNRTLTMSYDAVGNRNVLQEPGGGRFTTSYDAINRPVTMINPNGRVMTIVYDAVGQQTKFTDSQSNLVVTQVFGATGLLNNAHRAKSATRVLASTYTYDSAGRKILIDEQGHEDKSSIRTTLVYDNVDRLTGRQIKGGIAGTYTYDSVGNMTMKQEGGLPVTMTYNLAGQIAAMQDGPKAVTLSFDDKGNMTTENRGGVVTQFVYDQDNKMTAIVHPDMTRTTYTYGADGLRRLTLTPSGAVTTVIYDGSDYLKEEK